MKESVYEKIYDVVRQIPFGRVASYGQVARHVESCTARMVGYAMAALSFNSDVPWHRVINSQGKISLRADGREDAAQRALLETEGIDFDHRGRINFEKFGWQGFLNTE